jgi:hypothetical protein
MKRKSVVRQVTLGALATGLVPLTAAGAGAGPTDGSGAALCRSTFGDRGPTEGQVVGEGPSGDSMVVSVGWNPRDWPGDIGRIVTCVSVDGRAVPELANSTVGPPNTGSLMLDLTLPPGEPGALVCEQSVLVGKDDTPGRTPPTSPVCFKLRASDPPAPTRAGGRASAGTPAPGPPAPVGPPAPPAPVSPPVAAPKAPTTPPALRPGPGPDPASTPPARAAFEAAVGATRTPSVRPAATAATPAPKARAAAGAATPAAATATPDPAAAPATALARTGIDEHIPLTGAGALFAFGGLAIMFGEPRRRSWSGRTA